MSSKLNRYSARITQPKSQGASQAMLYGTGLSREDMDKAEVGISSVWYEGNTCNMHLMDLADLVKQGVQAAGMVGMRFNTIGVSDGISMGTDGMSYSLQSRDIIADSVETVMNAQWYDANISIPGCDKNMPGVMIAMARINRPSLMVYGGTIKPGYTSDDHQPIDIVSAFQSYGQYIAHSISDAQRQDIVEHACPGRAPVAACIRPTRWPVPSRRWACHCRTVRPPRRSTRANATNACVPAPPSGNSWNGTSNRATS